MKKLIKAIALRMVHFAMKYMGVTESDIFPNSPLLRRWPIDRDEIKPIELSFNVDRDQRIEAYPDEVMQEILINKMTKSDSFKQFLKFETRTSEDDPALFGTTRYIIKIRILPYKQHFIDLVDYDPSKHRLEMPIISEEETEKFREHLREITSRKHPPSGGYRQG